MNGSPTHPDPAGCPRDRLFWLGVAGIVVCAFGVRLAYLFQVELMPFFYHPVGDAASYWDWAGRIAAGDWMGNETFYQAPAYPYFLAWVRLTLGDDLWRARLVQIALGAVSCGLLVLAGRAFLSRGAGLAAGLIVAFYGPAMFFDGLIQKASLSLFLMSLLLCLLGQMERGDIRVLGRDGPFHAPEARGPKNRMSPFSALLIGVVLGLLALTHEQALVLCVIVPIWLTTQSDGIYRLYRAGARRPPERRGRWSGLTPLACLLGLGVVLGLVGWRNDHLGGEVALTTFQAGPNFYIGNHDGATGRYVALQRGHEMPPFERKDATALAEAALGHRLTPAQVSDYWWGRAWDFIRHHPGRWASLLLYKWMLVWNAYEIPDTESYALYAHLSWLLSVCGGLDHFGVLCPLAAVGLVATWRRRSELWLLYFMLATLAVGVAAFYVLGRYRYPLVPILALFAGAGLCEVRRWLRSIQIPAGGTAAVVIVVTAVATNLPLNPERRLDGMAYANLGAVLGQEGRYDAAIDFLQQAVEQVPDSPEAHFNLGMAYRLKGDDGAALQAFRRARELDPQLRAVDTQMGLIYEKLGHKPNCTATPQAVTTTPATTWP